jgi:hypothetical protein
MTYPTLSTTLWVSLLALAAPSLAQSDGQTLTSHDIYLSHLSPMIRYLPTSTRDDIPNSWNVTLESHSATRTGAGVEFGFFGRIFEVWGNGSNYAWGMTDMGGNNETKYLTYQEVGEPPKPAPLTGVPLGWHDVRLRVDETDPSYLDISGFTLITELPRVE